MWRNNLLQLFVKMFRTAGLVMSIKITECFLMMDDMIFTKQAATWEQQPLSFQLSVMTVWNRAVDYGQWSKAALMLTDCGQRGGKEFVKNSLMGNLCGERISSQRSPIELNILWLIFLCNDRRSIDSPWVPGELSVTQTDHLASELKC